MTLLERLHAAAEPYLDGTWRYGHANRVAYKWPPGILGPAVAAVVPDREIDCVGLSASIVMRVYPEAGWTQDDYTNLFIAKRPIVPDAPIRAVERVGVGERVAEFSPGRLHLVQGVRSFEPFSGHAVFVYDRGNGILDVLESTSKERGRGPRWRTSTAKALHAGDGKRGEFPAALYIARLT